MDMEKGLIIWMIYTVLVTKSQFLNVLIMEWELITVDAMMMLELFVTLVKVKSTTIHRSMSHTET